VLGNLDAVVDWGYAPDYVDAFTRILAQDEPDDFVVATGIGHTVRDFAAAAFGRVGLDWAKHVVQDPSVLALARSGRIGNSTKLRRITNWRPSMTFEEMVSTLVDQVAQDVQRDSD
jgi:GDPmannose 4,6-dehydratase